ncbi:trypsin-like peptidase domain-containing protein [Kitasatospora sp. NPDC092948]|uniref:nSTAND1 domain-containing NTPase n=1 Tax=Kitasatospora sp. NPDC092948 TaxID=3364088 RepID=UPI00380897E5
MLVERGTARAGAVDGLPAAVAQVCDGAGLVVGAGFLVADGLVVTCAHVLVDGGYGPGATVTLVFPHAPGAPTVTGRVLEDAWREPHEQDVALVQLERTAGVAPLSLGSAAGARGHRVRSFGFPVQAPPGGHFGFATAGGLLPAADTVGELLQLTDANDLTQGFSGGPVLDEATGLVVGMLTAITAPDSHDRGLGIAYVTPTSVLREAWPALQARDVSPYRALEPFTAEHAHWFRGREDAVRQVLAGLAGGRRVVLLLGPSGSGKSSLVQAGVLPALAAGRLPGSDRWRQVLTRPGPDLPAALARAGRPPAEAGGTGANTPGGTADGVRESRVVLVVDQFEEILAPSAGPQALHALAWITAAIRSNATLSVILVMRDDFYPRLSALAPDLLEAALQARGVLNVPATLSTSDLDAIVTGPARDLDTSFDPGLAEQIIADVLALNPRTAGTPDAPVTVLPLLEVALTRLWERRLDHDGRLTHDAYRRIGAVTGALTDWCDTALRELTTPQRQIARRILTALVRPADASLNIPAARQQLPLGELRELATDNATPDALRAVDEVLAVLSRHRIVTTDRVHDSGRPDGVEGTAVAELVHDALIRDWDTLRRWVEQDLRFHDWLHRARQQHTRWQEHRNPQDLPTGTLLAEGTDWSNHRRLPGGLDDFLAAGRHRQQAAARRSQRLNTVLATALALALIASGVAFWQQQSAVAARQIAVAAQQVANAQRLTAQSRQLAAQSAALTVSKPELAALLAVAAYNTSPTAEAAAALSAGAHFPLRRRLSVSSTGGVDSVEFSRDGHLVTGSSGNTVQLWDVTTGKATGSLPGDPGSRSATSAAFSPDGHTVGTASAHGAVQLWDTTTGRTETLTHDAGTTSAVVFSPDGRTLATGGKDGQVQLWDTATGKATATPPRHTDVVWSVVFSPNGHTLATGGESGPVQLWDMVTGKTTFTGQRGRVWSVAFSPDGRTLATSGENGFVRLWDTATGAGLATFTGYTGIERSVAFSHDGRTLAIGCDDGIVRFWDTTVGTTAAATATVASHTGAVRSVAFSDDDHTLATGGEDGSARLWDTDAIKAVTTFTGHISSVRSVAFGPGGHTLATASSDGSVRLWDATTGKTTATLVLTPVTDNIESVESAVFSPDGRILAIASIDGSVRLWDPATNRTTDLIDPTGHISSVRSVVFGGPGGRLLATAGSDGSVRLWDTDTGANLATLSSVTDNVDSAKSVAFNPDGHTLTIAGIDGSVRLWDPAANRTTDLVDPTDQTSSVRSVALSPGGRILATAGSDGSVRLWHTDTRKTTELADFTDAVDSVVFGGPDGLILATAGSDGSVRLWDTDTGANLATFTGRGPVTSVAFSPDGHTLAAGNDDATARLWYYTAPGDAIRTICAAAARDLTPKERAAYLPQSSEPVCRP